MIELFIAGSTARTAAHLVGVNKSTASYYFLRFRVLIHSHSEALEMFDGEVEVDELYFGGRRKSKRGRGAAGKIPVFGLLKCNGRVYTDTFISYNAPDISEFKHYRINHSKLFANKYNHISGIENFWNQAKRQIRKFNGIPKEHFHLFLKECKWRFNSSNPKNQLKQLNQWVRREMG